MTATTNGAFRILMACREDRLVRMPDLVTRLGLAEALVVKSCHALMKAGYLVGRRGHGGGYRLGRPAAAIGVLEIVDLFEPPSGLFPCRLGIDDECRIVGICRLRTACETAFAAFRRELAALTLADLVLGLPPVTDDGA